MSDVNANPVPFLYKFKDFSFVICEKEMIAAICSYVGIFKNYIDPGKILDMGFIICCCVIITL